jgi:hypothetical protein
MGVSLFGPLIPAAHVELNSAQLRDTPFKKQLDILTAGVWMNMYLALITFFVVPKLLPALLFPTHALGVGLAVTDVFSGSGAGGYLNNYQKTVYFFGISNWIPLSPSRTGRLRTWRYYFWC